MSYTCNCEKCGCTISMGDDFNEADERVCEECRNDEYLHQEKK